MEAFLEFKIFDKTFVGILNTMKLKQSKMNYYSKQYQIARDNMRGMNQENFSKKHPFESCTFEPPQTSASMIDGFITVLLLGETFEILHKIMALSPEYAN